MKKKLLTSLLAFAVCASFVIAAQEENELEYPFGIVHSQSGAHNYTYKWTVVPDDEMPEITGLKAGEPQIISYSTFRQMEAELQAYNNRVNQVISAETIDRVEFYWHDRKPTNPNFPAWLGTPRTETTSDAVIIREWVEILGQMQTVAIPPTDLIGGPGHFAVFYADDSPIRIDLPLSTGGPVRVDAATVLVQNSREIRDRIEHLLIDVWQIDGMVSSDIGGVCEKFRGRLYGGEEYSIGDALAILRYTVGLPSILNICPDAYAAALIVSEDTPGVRDALQILRSVVGLSSVLD
jgi:hypothetical protein